MDKKVILVSKEEDKGVKSLEVARKTAVSSITHMPVLDWHKQVPLKKENSIIREFRLDNTSLN